MFFILFFLLNVNGICEGQTITIRYIGNSETTINLTYLFIELGNSTVALNKSNRILTFESNTPQIIKCDDISRNTIIYVEPNETIDIDVDNRGMLLYNSKKSSFRAFDSGHLARQTGLLRSTCHAGCLNSGGEN